MVLIQTISSPCLTAQRHGFENQQIIIPLSNLGLNYSLTGAARAWSSAMPLDNNYPTQYTYVAGSREHHYRDG
jgi:hypothetical protein